MIIHYKNKRIENLCCDYSLAKKRIGEKVANGLAILLTDLKFVPHVDMFNTVAKLKKYRMHVLIGDKKEIYSLSIDYSYRLCIKVEVIDTGYGQDEICIVEVTNHYE